MCLSRSRQNSENQDERELLITNVSSDGIENLDYFPSRDESRNVLGQRPNHPTRSGPRKANKEEEEAAREEEASKEKGAHEDVAQKKSSAVLKEVEAVAWKEVVMSEEVVGVGALEEEEAAAVENEFAAAPLPLP